VSAVLFDAEVGHLRAAPARHEVRHRSPLWFVDLDELPRLPRGLRWLARFESRDHAGDPGRSLRANLDAYLAENGIDLRGGRITMLAAARSGGYVFNPLSLFWCHGAGGELCCVVAEVHNTYRQRHRYLLRPDENGHAETEKRFYVSPFYPVDGHYRMSLPEPTDRLALRITLHRPGDRPFVATVNGTARPATTRAVLATAVRRPLHTWRVRAAIIRHGIALWRKGLPVQHRLPAERSTTVATVAARLALLVRRELGVELPVRLRAWDGSESGPTEGPVLVLNSRRALRRLLWAPGELGLARAYVTGDADVEGDLTEAFRRAWHAARTRPSNGGRPGPRGLLRAAGTAARLGAIGPPPGRPAAEASLTGALHTRSRDRAAIAHHYDLSNEFYALLLDETMSYSCAYFTDPAQSLADAQRAKLDLVCAKLQLRPGMRLLDVGCGWGALILHAAEHHGVRATGITLSARQRDHVAKQIAERGLADRVSVRLQDYRELASSDETYDAVASIEMGEHVGQDRYPAYVQALFAALRPGGLLVLQQMSRRADAAPGGGAFIESYIAPDMHMRPPSQTLRFLEQAGFELRGVEAMREQYVTTVHRWIDTLQARYPQFVALVGEQVARVWTLYLAGGALSFEQGRMGVDQFLARRPPE
jgi:cyclopropane fatty-acyl-phospholipid synthase-like methyltransferase/DUF1365 family protein